MVAFRSAKDKTRRLRNVLDYFREPPIPFAERKATMAPGTLSIDICRIVDLKRRTQTPFGDACRTGFLTCPTRPLRSSNRERSSSINRHDLVERMPVIDGRTKAITQRHRILRTGITRWQIVGASSPTTRLPVLLTAVANEKWPNGRNLTSCARRGLIVELPIKCWAIGRIRGTPRAEAADFSRHHKSCCTHY